MNKEEKKQQEPDEDYFLDDEEEFIRCDKCDGHDACEDFGCAFDLGLGHLVKKENGNYEL